MNLTTDFSHKYLLNLTRRQDRRVRCEQVFVALGWSVLRQPAVDARRLKSARGFAAPGRYAHAVSTRMILRRAALAGAKAVLILEDDVIFHPALEERLAAITLPEDWGIFYLGCQQCERPEVVAPGLARVSAALDTHAWAVRREHFLEARRAMRGKYWPGDGPVPAADILLAELSRRVPAYAAYPNLAWQEEEYSDLAGGAYANYEADGRQKHNRECLSGALAESLGGVAWAPAAQTACSVPGWFWPHALRRKPLPSKKPLEPLPPPPLTTEGRVAFLFLTRGPHLHPGMWAEYWTGHGQSVAVYGHAKDRTWPTAAGDWLLAAQIAAQVETEWGELSLVRAQLALLEAALKDRRNEFFVFASESCVPVRPLADLLRLLRMDGRSRFAAETLEQVKESHPHKAARAPRESRLPPGDWRFHSQWILLNLEAAELLAANAELLECFAGTHAPDECTFGTMLHAAGYPLQKRVAAQHITWSRWPAEVSAHPDTISAAEAAVIGDIVGSGCFFARKFAAESDPRKWGLHREG